MFMLKVSSTITVSYVGKISKLKTGTENFTEKITFLKVTFLN